MKVNKDVFLCIASHCNVTTFISLFFLNKDIKRLLDNSPDIIYEKVCKGRIHITKHQSFTWKEHFFCVTSVDGPLKNMANDIKKLTVILKNREEEKHSIYDILDREYINDNQRLISICSNVNNDIKKFRNIINLKIAKKGKPLDTEPTPYCVCDPLNNGDGCYQDSDEEDWCHDTKYTYDSNDCPIECHEVYCFACEIIAYKMK
jgi:hypothetical protein